MSSRKAPHLLSDRQIRRRVAQEKKKLLEESDAILEKYKKSLNMDDSDVMELDDNPGSVIALQNREKINPDEIDDVEFGLLLKDLSKADTSEEYKSESKNVEHILPENSQQIREETTNDVLNIEDKFYNDNFDFFDLMKNALCVDDEIEDWNNEDDKKYLDSLTSSDQKDPKILYMNEIRALCIKYIHTIPHVFINELLDKLKRQTGYPFPKDARTFLKTPRASVVRQMGEGQYCHYGIKSALTNFLTAYKKNGIDTDCIKLIANIDGALLVNSSEDTSWIISVSDTILNLVEVVGIYDGPKKPEDSDELVHEFVHELVDLINNGIKFESKIYKVSLHCLVCDAPAKSYIMKTKLYSGYYSCSKCTIKGDYMNKVIFPKEEQEKAILRTDEKFMEQEYSPNKAVFDEFQTGETIMKKIPNFRPITDVILDYMHLVCLGVMLKLIELWIQNPKVALSEYERKMVSDKLLSFKEFMTSDFSRNPRQFKNVRRLWKAHELRAFLLYTGPIALYKILPSDLYLNFLCLHVAITILVNPILCENQEYLDYAEKLLISFVESFENCYGKVNMVFNIHNLLHLVNDVRRFGHLDSFSAFRFENHIRKVKQLIRKGDKRLQQIANRLMEIKAAKEYCVEVDCGETNFLLKPESELFYVVKQKSLKIDCRNEKDKYVLLDNGLYLECEFFIKMNGQVYVEGRPFKTVEHFYEQPLRSNILNINIIKHSDIKNSERFLYKNILAKICKLPFERIEEQSTDDESIESESIEHASTVEEFVAVPLIHTFRRP